MNHNYREPIYGASLILLCLLALVIGLFYGRRVIKTGFVGTFLYGLLTAIATGGTIFATAYRLEHYGYDGPRDQGPQIIFGSGLATLCIWFLGTKLYASWILGRASDAELAPGATGLRAWLSPGKAVLALGAAIGVASTREAGFWQALFFASLALVALPVARWILAGLAETSAAHPSNRPRRDGHDAPNDGGSPGGEAGAAEREKILALLEAGRVTADEAAELLNALAAAQGGGRAAPTPRGAPMTQARKLAFIGAAIVAVGFFLPWFSFNAGTEIQRQVEQSGVPIPPGYMTPSTATTHISGGDIHSGLGWIVLLLALAAASLPWVLPSGEPNRLRQWALVGLGAGSLVLLYLLTQNPRIVSIGIVLALAGYAIEATGVARDRLGSAHAFGA